MKGGAAARWEFWQLMEEHDLIVRQLHDIMLLIEECKELLSAQTASAPESAVQGQWEFQQTGLMSAEVLTWGIDPVRKH